MYTFTKVSLSQERTSVLSSIFHLFHNHPMSKIWKQCWALVRQRRIGNKHCLISTSSHLHQRGRQELRVITTILCGKYHSGRSIGHVEAKQRVARLRVLNFREERKQESLLLERDDSLSHLSLAFGPLILWSSLFCPLESRYGSALGKSIHFEFLDPTFLP
jgi:hypothetical protein